MTFTDWLPERRVRKVQLHATNETLLRRGSMLLEDALHTASIPGEQSGRLLLIRRLDVGKIDSRASPAHLSLAVEQRLLQIGLQTVYAGAPTAATAPAVYFHDPLDALLILAERLIHGPAPLEWFWPMAVPDWNRNLPRPVALRRLLGTAFRTSAGIAGTVIFLRELLERSSLDPLLAALSPQDGLTMLGAFGWTEADFDHSINTPANQASPLLVTREPSYIPMKAWESTLRRWTTMWGHVDPRSLFLVAVAIIAENTARLAAPAALLVAARQVLGTLALETVLLTDRSRKSISVRQPYENQGSQRQTKVAEVSNDGIAKASVLKDDTSKTAELPHTEGQSTVLAGLFFLLPLLERLGMSDLLESQPELLELDLPKHILLRVWQKFAPSADDPAVAFLQHEIDQRTDIVAPSAFVAPAIWATAVCHPNRAWQIRRKRDSPGARLLCDSSGRLVLAFWNYGAPGSVKKLLRQTGKVEGIQPAESERRVIYHPHPFPSFNIIDLLIDTWVIALRRRLRIDSGLALGELVRRPGRVSFTSTHLDVTLDLNDADLRVRKAGLDLDPGWLPWFGKVVRFHYVRDH